MAQARKIVMDPFCFKQFDSAKIGSVMINMDKEEFAARINEFYLQVKDEGGLKDGYAPFCKHLFIENFTDTMCSYAKITPENQQFIKSGYIARNERELPVLSRWFDKTQMSMHRAAYLDIILYSKEQIQKENAAMDVSNPNADLDYDYGIVSIKPQDVDYECPMQPITAMRNALGKDQGGSGIPLDPVKYRECVEFWKLHAIMS